ncbi:hypothetical protein RGU75_02335 [Glaciimonas sp. CA11.2]|uniref:hypothetical protein n=1 Tax=Glaciimonas sp. CA11.2 TaxID=3048601 RepID=UPI002AB44CC6|nr:hypothetical protein [Glaciimonas sp. CA11.2]MDY7545071.1 hypothetical protein [Glaciimonas sp. CA11.2]
MREFNEDTAVNSLNQKHQFISIDELKSIVYRESGFKLQISEDDPLLTTVYINLAVLGSSIEAAGELHREMVEQINRLPAAADQQLKRASHDALESMSIEVANLANRIAGDAASAERANAFSRAIVSVLGGLLVSSGLFFITGFYLSRSVDSQQLNKMKSEVNLVKGDAEERVRAAHIETEAELDGMRRSIGWTATPDGKIAKIFFESGAGMVAAKCVSPVWDIVQTTGGKYCVPKRRDLFGGDEEKYGWKIP